MGGADGSAWNGEDGIAGCAGGSKPGGARGGEAGVAGEKRHSLCPGVSTPLMMCPAHPEDPGDSRPRHCRVDVSRVRIRANYSRDRAAPCGPLANT